MNLDILITEKEKKRSIEYIWTKWNDLSRYEFNFRHWIINDTHLWVIEIINMFADDKYIMWKAILTNNFAKSTKNIEVLETINDNFYNENSILSWLWTKLLIYSILNWWKSFWNNTITRKIILTSKLSSLWFYKKSLESYKKQWLIKEYIIRWYDITIYL